MVQDSKGGGTFYIRDDFSGTGQDSHTRPFAQDQAMWERFENCMPVTRGTIDKRWGYDIFTTTGTTRNGIQHLYEYQRDTDGQRAIVACPDGLDNTNVSAFTESGTGYNSNIFTSTLGYVPRMLNSRSFAYFFDGVRADQNKWDGSTNANSATNWGIDQNDTTNSSIGPKPPASIVPAGGSAFIWTNPSRMGANDAQYATVSFTRNNTNVNFSEVVTLSNYAMGVAGAIAGIEVQVVCSFTRSSGTGTPSIILQLEKGGVRYGVQKSVAIPLIAPGIIVFGGPTDQWGGQWFASELNASNFGVAMAAINPTATASLIAVDSIRVKVYLRGSTIAVLPTVSGAVTLQIGRRYFLSYLNGATGHYSDISGVSASTGPLTARGIPLALPVANDPQVTAKAILATADGGDETTLYQLAEVPNSTISVQDNTPETSLLQQQLMVFTDEFGNEFGVAGNSPPPLGRLCIKHKGRLYMAQNQTLYFSKNNEELTLPNGFIAGKYEESWPGDNSMDISEGAETVTGLLSDGIVLYIGTQRHIRRLFGDGPDNFEKPEIVHNEVGVMRQETWQVVFAEGQPVGAMWLTPDLRVVGSDFNTYGDVGHPIQDLLDTANPGICRFLAHAQFVTSASYDLYILHIPTGTNIHCDLQLVYDLRSRRWGVWRLTDPTTGSLFNVAADGTPQWFFVGAYSGTTATTVNGSPLVNEQVFIGVFNPNSLTDRGNSATPVPVTSTIQSTWLGLGSPTERKVLQQIELAGDTSMTVTIAGASTQAETNTPNAVVTAKPLVVSPFGNYKVYLAPFVSRDRFYRLNFATASTANPVFLNSYSLNFVPVNTL